MNRADRRLAMKRPGGFERLLNEAWENGFQAGKTFSCKTLCAAMALSLHALSGMDGPSIAAAYRDAVQRIFDADCPEMLLEQCQQECGVAPGMFDFDRAAAKMEDEDQTP